MDDAIDIPADVPWEAEPRTFGGAVRAGAILDGAGSIANSEEDPAPVRASSLGFFAGLSKLSSSPSEPAVLDGLAMVKTVRLDLVFSGFAGGGNDNVDSCEDNAVEAARECDGGGDSPESLSSLPYPSSPSIVCGVGASRLVLDSATLESFETSKACSLLFALCTKLCDAYRIVSRPVNPWTSILSGSL